MKSGIHPNYYPVVFRDITTRTMYLIRSTVTSRQTIEWSDGNTYPLIDVEITADNHPFHTGKARRLSITRRVEEFQQRYGRTGWPRNPCG